MYISNVFWGGEKSNLYSSSMQPECNVCRNAGCIAEKKVLICNLGIILFVLHETDVSAFFSKLK